MAPCMVSKRIISCLLGCPAFICSLATRLHFLWNRLLQAREADVGTKTRNMMWRQSFFLLRNLVVIICFAIEKDCCSNGFAELLFGKLNCGQIFTPPRSCHRCRAEQRHGVSSEPAQLAIWSDCRLNPCHLPWNQICDLLKDLGVFSHNDGFH